MRLCFTEIHDEPFYGSSFDLGPGLHVVLAEESDGIARLIELASGLVKPRHGRVEIDHQQPYYSPKLRGRIGSLLPDPNLPAAKTVVAYVDGILKLKAAQIAAAALLSEWQLDSLGPRSTLSLDDDEARSLALALALATPTPALLCCHDPLTTLLPRQRVVERLRSAAENGTIVLLAMSRTVPVDLLPASVLVLARGRLLRAVHAEMIGDLATGYAPTTLIVSSDARQLAAMLSKDSRITAMAWDAGVAPGSLRVWAADIKGVGQAVVEAALLAGIDISYFGSEPLSLSTIQSDAHQDAASGHAGGTDIKG